MPVRKTPRTTSMSRRFLIGAGVFVVVVLVIWWASARGHSPAGAKLATPSPTPSPSASPSTSPHSGGSSGSTSSTPSASPTPQPSVQPSVSPAVISAPILQKSSGNNGSVPSGNTIEFVCRTETNQACTILLKNTATGVIKDLGSKTTKADGRGLIGATWDWTSAAGTYTVVAKASKDGGEATSIEQTLTVQ